MARLLLRRDLTIAVIGFLFIVQAIIRYGSPLDPNVAWYLYAGGRLLDGAGLYTDIVEVNPPLALWLTMPIVALARIFGIDVTILFHTLLLILTAVSVILSAKFLAAASDVSAATRHIVLILLAALMLFVPAGEFGQREHVTIILITPWILLRWNRLLDRDVSWGLAASVGVMAAAGLWLKPLFVFVVIVVEVTMVFATRNARTMLRSETLTIVVLSIAYMIAIRLIWSKGLLATIALFGTRAYIPIYGVAPEEIILQLILPVGLAVIVTASASLLSEHLRLLRTLLFVVGSAFVCIYVLQAGYRYQIVPALFFLALAAGLGIARVVAGDVRLGSMHRRLVATAAVVAILAVFAGVWSTQHAEYQGRPFASAIAAEAPDARTIFIASTEVSHPFPLVNQQDLVWASRFPSQWLSPYVAGKLNDDGGPADDIARFQLEATVSDLIAFQPDIVFIDEAPTRRHDRGTPLNYRAFWQHDLRFLAFWRDYEKRATVGDFAVYVRNKSTTD